MSNSVVPGGVDEPLFKVKCIRTKQRWCTLHTRPECNTYTTTFMDETLHIGREYEVVRETKTQYILKSHHGDLPRRMYMRVSKDYFQVVRNYQDIKHQLLGVDK